MILPFPKNLHALDQKAKTVNVGFKILLFVRRYIKLECHEALFVVLINLAYIIFINIHIKLMIPTKYQFLPECKPWPPSLEDHFSPFPQLHSF